MRKREPKYRLQKSTGRALVEIDGKRIYLGKYGTTEAWDRYLKIKAEWCEKVGRPAPSLPFTVDGPVFIEALIVHYWEQEATTYYVKDGEPTSEQDGIRAALKKLRKMFGKSEAPEFDQLKLEAYQQALIDEGLRVTTINQHVGRIKRAFRWAANKKLVPVHVWQQLLTVRNLKTGRTKAKPPRDIKPVPDEAVEATLPYLSDVVAAMVRFQRLTGCRPGEVCQLRPCDIERPAPDPQRRLEFGETAGGQGAAAAGGKRKRRRGAPEGVWIYRPSRHKTQHHGKERRVYIGPQAQAVLLPWLAREPESYCFSPREARAPGECDEQNETLPFMQAATRAGRRRVCYDKDSYRRAIVYGLCRLAQALGHELPTASSAPGKRKPTKKAKWRAPKRAWFESVGVTYWHPNQVRHTAATELESDRDLDAARTVLGHSDERVTRRYAEKDFERAAETMRELG